MTPLWPILGYICLANMACNTCNAVMVFLETGLIRLLVTRVFKRVPTILDEFFATYLIILNFCFSAIHASQNLLAGNGVELAARVAAQPISNFPKPKISFKNTLFIFFLGAAINGVNIVLSFKDKCSDYSKRQKVQLSVVPLPTINSINENNKNNNNVQQVRLNNQSKNEELISVMSQTLLAILFVALPMPSLIVYKFLEIDHSLNETDVTLLDMTRFVSFFVLFPLILYARNSKLRKHFTENFILKTLLILTANV